MAVRCCHVSYLKQPSVSMRIQVSTVLLTRLCVDFENMRSRISDTDKRRLFEAAERGEDYIALANQLNILPNTAYAIVRRARLRGGQVVVPRGGHTHHKLDDDIGNALVAIVEEHPGFTLRQINQELQSRLPDKPHLSLTTLCRGLEGRFLVLKKFEDSVAERNSDQVKERRMAYAQWLMMNGVNNELVFLDECGINLWTRRTRGRAPRGSRAVRVVTARRGRNFTVIFAVGHTRGLIFHEIFEGGMTRERFHSMLSTISADNEGPLVFICDNASSHSGANLLPEEGGPNLRAEHRCVYLPPYSPFLNIVENAISAFKWSLKNSLEEVRSQLLEQQHETRLATMTQLAEQAVEVITPGKATRWFTHSQRYVPACLQGSDILM